MSPKLPLFDHNNPTVAWVLVATACIANFIDLFQSSMVLFALPSIRDELHFSLVDLNWVVLAYSLTFATFLLPAGQAADRLGPRNTFLAGTFTLAWTNALSAFAPNLHGLIAGRALAGVGAAMVSATGIPIITRVFDEGKTRNTAMAVYVSCAPIGTILGVVIGALLSASAVGWRSNFWLVLILAGLVTLAAIILIPHFDLARDTKPIDYLGIGTFVAGAALFVYGLNDAERLGWKSPAIIVTLILGGLLLIAFPIIERNVAHPALARNIIFDSRVVVPLTTFAITGGCWVTWFYVATQVSLNVLKYSTILAACYFLPATAAAIVGGGIGNTLVQKGIPKAAIIGGYVLGIGSLVPWGLINTSHGIWYVIVFALLYLFSQPPITVGAQNLILSEVPVINHGTASALMYVVYQFGSALFLAIVNVVLGSSDQNTPQGLLKGYQNSMWTLLGITSAGFIGFMAFYAFEAIARPAKSRPSQSSAAPLDDGASGDMRPTDGIVHDREK